MRVATLMVLVVSLGLPGCRQHVLQDGAYDVRLVEPLRDDCQLAAQSEVFARGTLLTAGHIVRFSSEYLGAELAGTYRYGLEEMTLDATLANVRTRLRGQDCQVDTVAVAMDTVTQSPVRFTGQLNYQFTSKSNDACSCRFFFRFEATRAGGP
ncbi:MAG: hypothetical protein MUC96_09050 [Myxococcaceae bacterium]|jgi:hypothetical protein|nr:hypothetical protein [Myxococcaceae bacterium]